MASFPLIWGRPLEDPWTPFWKRFREAQARILLRRFIDGSFRLSAGNKASASSCCAGRERRSVFHGVSNMCDIGLGPCVGSGRRMTGSFIPGSIQWLVHWFIHWFIHWFKGTTKPPKRRRERADPPKRLSLVGEFLAALITPARRVWTWPA